DARGDEAYSLSIVILRHNRCHSSGTTISHPDIADLDLDPDARTALAMHTRAGLQPTISFDHRAATARTIEIDSQIIQRLAH
uniref:hypothetical protein n=1 Tax=Sphingomonas bacterium TaxID=1895847 RepID=UPI002630B4D9